jgi:hypothetical protein
MCRYFVSQSSEFCRHNPLCCISTSAVFLLFISLSTQSGNFWIHPRSLIGFPCRFHESKFILSAVFPVSFTEERIDLDCICPGVLRLFHSFSSV